MVQGRNTLRSTVNEESRVCKISKQGGGISASSSCQDDSRQMIKLPYIRKNLLTLKNALYWFLIIRGETKGRVGMGQHFTIACSALEPAPGCCPLSQMGTG